MRRLVCHFVVFSKTPKTGFLAARPICYRTNRIMNAPSKDSDQYGQMPRLIISLCCGYEKFMRSLLHIKQRISSYWIAVKASLLVFMFNVQVNNSSVMMEQMSKTYYETHSNLL